MVNQTLFNASGVIGQAITSAGDTTGDIFLTLLLIVIVLVIICLAAGLPMETSVIVVLPLIFGSWAVSGEFVSVGGVAVIYLAVIFAKNFFFK